MKPGYNFPTLPVPQNAPWWVDTARAQRIMDGAYQRALDNYYGQGDAWVQTQTVLRSNSADANRTCNSWAANDSRHSVRHAAHRAPEIG